MAKPIPIFRASTGLNVKVDPVRIPYDPQTGISDLQATMNIDHDPTGRPSRRKGYDDTPIVGGCHSLFCQGGDALMVVGTDLCILYPDLTSYFVLATVTEGAMVSYAQLVDTTFWMNGFEKGFVRHGVNHDWVRGDYYGPTSKRLLSDPPIGNIVRIHSGFVYIAQHSVLWHSDPYSLNAFNLARNQFMFEGTIGMVRPTAGGIYVGTDKGVSFLYGTSPKDFRFLHVSESPIIEGTDVEVDFNEIGFEQLLQNRTGKGVMWTSTAGVFLGTADGQAFNLTKDKLTRRSAARGAAQIIDGNYVVTLAP